MNRFYLGIFAFNLLYSLYISTAHAEPQTPAQESEVTAPEASASEVSATEAGSQRPSKWGGEAEVGFVMTRGNTDTDSLNLKFLLTNERPKWKHKLQLKVLNSSEQENVTAESYDALWRSEYLMSIDDFLFGSVRYEDDRFAGFDQRTTEVFGYGYRVIHTDSMQLSLEVGVGARQTTNTDNSEEDETIGRLGLDYNWKISKTASFKENVFVESGDKNTLTESVTEMTVKVNRKLAMKLGLTVKNNSDVPLGRKNTDTKTAVTLVYDLN